MFGAQFWTLLRNSEAQPKYFLIKKKRVCDHHPPNQWSTRFVDLLSEFGACHLGLGVSREGDLGPRSPVTFSCK